MQVGGGFPLPGTRSYPFRTLRRSRVLHRIGLRLNDDIRDNSGMTKRNYGQGTMYERRPGVFLLRVNAVDPVTGERRRVSETFAGGKKDAARRLSELVVESNRKGPATDLSVADVVRDFRSVANHATGTAKGYDVCWKNVPDGFARTKARDLDVATVDRLYARLLNDGISVHSVRRLHALLGASFNQSIRWGRLSFNPVQHAKCPTAPEPVIALPDDNAIARLWELVKDDPEMRCWMRVLMATGGRRGETLGLRWTDIVGDTVTIRRQVGPDGSVVNYTKTRKERTLAVDPGTVTELEAWRSTKTSDTGFVFSRDPHGELPHRGDSVYRRFKKLARKAGMPDARVHTMRHLMVSLLLDAGQSLEVASRRAGHSSTAFTARTYSHLVNGADRRAADVLGGLLPRR